MYAVVEITGHQYRVKAGDVLDVEKISAEVGSEVDFDQVYFIGGKKPLVGVPTVKGAKVKAQVVKQDRGRKILVQRNDLKNEWMKRRGHRQYYTSLLITELNDGQGNSAKAEKKAKKTTKSKE